MALSELIPKIDDIIHHKDVLLEEKLVQICHVLNDNVDYYDWVGFYFVNGDKPELLLGPYVGESTEHTVIPFGKGICGQVAVSNETFIVPDVSAQDNYIACSITVKSEIVVPIFANGKNIGQIDIDSHIPDAFNEMDQQFLEDICAKISRLFEDSGSTSTKEELD